MFGRCEGVEAQQGPLERLELDDRVLIIEVASSFDSISALQCDTARNGLGVCWMGLGYKGDNGAHIRGALTSETILPVIHAMLAAARNLQPSRNQRVGRPCQNIQTEIDLYDDG